MEKEVIDYGKVTGMVHSTESFGAVDGRLKTFCKKRFVIVAVGVKKVGLQ